jgi:hypothetical protein
MAAVNLRAGDELRELQMGALGDEVARWRELFHSAARARPIAEAWRAQYEREAAARVALGAAAKRLQAALAQAQLTEQLALRDAETAAASARTARAETARWKHRCDSLASSKAVVEREELRAERDALLATAAKGTERPSRTPTELERRMLARKQLQLETATAAATAAAAADAAAAAAAAAADAPPPAVDEAAERSALAQARLLDAERQLAERESELQLLHERLQAASERQAHNERQIDAWRSKYMDEVRANREAAFSAAERPDDAMLARAKVEQERVLSARGLEAELRTWKELAIEREEMLRAVHRRLRALQAGGAANVATDLALREMRRDIERKLGPELGESTEHEARLL